MMLSLANLCKKAEEYLTSKAPISNRNKNYIPTGSLAAGAILKQVSFTITVPHDTTTRTNNAVMDIINSGIPSKYLTSVPSSKIISDWNTFINPYIKNDTSFNSYITLTSLIKFLSLFRCFIEARICYFTDVYGKSAVWLYDSSSSITYPSEIAYINTSSDTITIGNINSYMQTLINQITTNSKLNVLPTTSSISACSSSSCSSSSSSSCSSSCSSSSCSSSSSWFIAFFNI